MAATVREQNGDMMSHLLTATVLNPGDIDQIPASNTSMDMQDHIMGSPDQIDFGTLRAENRLLRSKLKQVENDLQDEQTKNTVLRKKLNNSEKHRLDASSKNNEEMSTLDAEVAKLRAQLEKGEADRQGLEFELAKARRNFNQEKRNVNERDHMMADMNENMKHKINELTGQIDIMCEELDSYKKKAQEDMRRLKEEIRDRDSELSAMRSVQDGLEEDKAKLETQMKNKDRTLTELEERLEELEDLKLEQTDKVRKQTGDLELFKEKEDRLKQELETAVSRVKSLEESIEAERAAHLESKFNHEIIQLRIRDLQGAIEMEKTGKQEAMGNTEKLGKQLKDLQKIYEEERSNSLKQKERIERSWMPVLKAEKEYAALSKQLHEELEEKRSIIKTLSQQLDVHQSEFNELKAELSKTKKRQIFLEETYSGCMKELELLIDNFSLEAPPPKKQKTKSSKEGPKKPTAPSVIMEKLRNMLIGYKRKVDEQSSQLNRVTVEHQAVNKECKQYKDMVWAKDKSLQSNAASLTNTSKELGKLRAENKELSILYHQIKADFDAAKHQLDKEMQQKHSLSDKIQQVATRFKGDERASLEFLHSLYEQLVVGQPVSKDKPSAGPFSFTDLSVMINEQVAILISAHRRTLEKLQHTEETLKSKEEFITQAQKAHDEQLEKLAEIAEGRTQQWEKQKEEMEQHYSQLLAEVHARTQKTQALADQAWEKVRATGSLQQGLEKECSDLRVQLVDTQKEHDTLLAACSLLIGGLYPLFVQCNALATERHIIMEELWKHQGFKVEVKKLVEALSLSQAEGQKLMTSDYPLMGPLLRFRKGVIAVIAANRLFHLARGHCRMFIVQDVLPGRLNTTVGVGGLEQVQTQFTGLSHPWLLETEKSSTRGEDFTLHWLTSCDLMSTVNATLGDLNAALQQAKQGGGVDSKKLVSLAKTSYQKLLCHLPSTFPSIPPDAHAGLREKASLVRLLQHGLNRALTQSSIHRGQPQFEPVQLVASQLQNRVLEFTERLYVAEVERRELRTQLAQLKGEKSTWSTTSGDIQTMQKELTQLRTQIEDAVERDRFEQVCDELNRALRREQQAQGLLQEQNQQLHQLSLKLDIQNSEGSEKTQVLQDAVQGLTETKMELRRQEQRVRQLTRQLELVETEKRNMMENIMDAENALKTSSKDRDALSIYLTSVEELVQKLKPQIPSGNADFTTLLSSSINPQTLGKVGPELLACQTLVASVVDTQVQMDKRSRALQEEIELHKSHIATLKKELSAACRREYDQEIEGVELGDYIPVQDYSKSTPSRPILGLADKENSFTPLQEDPNDTYGAPAVKNDKTDSKKSKFPTSKIPSRSSKQTTSNNTKSKR